MFYDLLLVTYVSEPPVLSFPQDGLSLLNMKEDIKKNYGRYSVYAFCNSIYVCLARLFTYPLLFRR